MSILSDNFTGLLVTAPGVGRIFEGPTLASAATIAITHQVHKVSGTTQVDLITTPYQGFRGFICLIPTGAMAFTSGATASGSNLPIKVTYTGVANRPIWVYCDGEFWWFHAIA